MWYEVNGKKNKIGLNGDIVVDSLYVKVNGNDECNEEFNMRLDEIFDKINGGDCLKKIRKEQIMNHHYKYEIIECLESYFGLFGGEIKEFEYMGEIYNERLINIHSPILLHVVPTVVGCFYDEKNWREWDIEDLFLAYDMLISENHDWIDYYTRKELYGNNGEDCKNYMVSDMLDYLVVCGKILRYEYDFRDLCGSWDFNQKICVKVNPNEIAYVCVGVESECKLW